MSVHGTRAAYLRHLRAGHRACAECAAANADFKRELKNAGARNQAARKRKAGETPAPAQESPPLPPAARPAVPPSPMSGDSLTLEEFVFLVQRERFRERVRAVKTSDRLADDDHRITRCRGCGAWKSTTGARCRPCVARARRATA